MNVHSRKAIWLAVDSEHGPRLVEIAREHIALTKELIMPHPNGDARWGMDTSHDVIRFRIAQLREERDAIISQFEEDIANANDDQSPSN